MIEDIIGIEALGIDEEGGARTSILNLISHVTRNNEATKFVVYLSKAEQEIESDNIQQVILPFRKGILARVFLQLYLPIDILLRKIKLIHFTKSQASLVFKAKMVLTIHDVTILKHPQIYPKLSVIYWKYIQPWMANKMDAIITVSHDAASDIVEFYKVKREKIFVIYNTSQFDSSITHDDTLWKAISQKYQLPDEYFLYVGILALKKNLETMIKAYQKFTLELDQQVPQLLLIGPRYAISDGSSVLDLISKLHLEDHIRYLGKLPKIDLYYIFKNATIFIFPSYHEGFGIPCLEAMQLGVPLIASNVSAIPEVVGSAGILINDYLSPNAWAAAIRDLYSDQKARTELINEGIKQFQIINNQHSLSSVMNIYLNLLKLPDK